MSLGRVDLNLLKVFAAIYEDGSLLLAGRRLNVSQSAVSHALSRLRELIGDELFMHTGRGMTPTSRAVALAPTIQDALRRVEAALGDGPFDPATSVRAFVVAANDHATVVMVTPLSERMQRVSPGISLVVRPSTRLDLAEQIDLGRIDLAIGVFSQVPGRLHAQTLVSHREVILMRKSHPVSHRKLTLKDIAHYPLVGVSVGGSEEGAVEGFIAERGLARQSEMFDRQALNESLRKIGAVPTFRVTVPHSLALPSLLRGSDMLTIVPATLATALTRTGELVAREPPYAMASQSTLAVWHSRNDHEVGHAWLREALADVARGLNASI